MRPFERLRGHLVLVKSASLLAVFMVLLAACRAGAAEQPAAGATPAPEEALPTESVPAGGEPFEVELEIGPGDFFLADPRLGLDALDSYTTTLVITFDGSQAGQPMQTTSTRTLWFSRDPVAFQLRVESPDETGESDPTFLARQGEVGYQVGADGSCTADLIEGEGGDALLQVLAPVGFVKSAYGAEAAGQDTINGVAADRYTFDQRALPLDRLASASGEFWVSADTGVLLKYKLTATAGADYFGEGIEGTVTWEYDLTDVNATVQPAFPEGCQVDAPLMADASEVLHLPRWLAYTTAAPFSEAAAFYQAKMPSKGWTLVSGPMGSESSTFMEFTRGADTVGVFATARDGATQVDVVLYDPED